MITDVLSTGKEVVRNALYSAFKDFEDGLQNYTAVENGQINVIITRNLKDYSKSEIAVLTPESYIKTIAENSDH